MRFTSCAQSASKSLQNRQDNFHFHLEIDCSGVKELSQCTHALCATAQNFSNPAMSVSQVRKFCGNLSAAEPRACQEAGKEIRHRLSQGFPEGRQSPPRVRSAVR